VGDGLSRRLVRLTKSAISLNNTRHEPSPKVFESTRFRGFPLKSRQSNCPYEFSCILRHSNRFFFGVFQPTFFGPIRPIGSSHTSAPSQVARTAYKSFEHHG
jgi:hypothetical protein